MVKKYEEYKVSENEINIRLTLCKMYLVLSAAYNKIVEFKKERGGGRLRMNQSGCM